MSKQKRTPAYEKLLEEIQQLPLGHGRTAKLGKLAAEHDRLWHEVAQATDEEEQQHKLREALSLNEKAAPLFTPSRDLDEFTDYLRQQLVTVETVAEAEGGDAAEQPVRSDFCRRVAAEAYARAVELRECDHTLPALPEQTGDPIMLLNRLREWCVRGQQAGPAREETGCEVSHSSDYRSVRWFGKEYSFPPNQAACVSILWQAWENGTPDVGDHHMLVQAGILTKRFRDVFRGNQAWGVMIVQGRTKGTHRLNPAEKK